MLKLKKRLCLIEGKDYIVQDGDIIYLDLIKMEYMNFSKNNFENLENKV